jgi:hypothetical protein
VKAATCKRDAIDAHYGGLAAPAIVDLEAKLDAQSGR